MLAGLGFWFQGFLNVMDLEVGDVDLKAFSTYFNSKSETINQLIA